MCQLNGATSQPTSLKDRIFYVLHLTQTHVASETQQNQSNQSINQSLWLPRLSFPSTRCHLLFTCTWESTICDHVILIVSKETLYATNYTE